MPKSEKFDVFSETNVEEMKAGLFKAGLILRGARVGTELTAAYAEQVEVTREEFDTQVTTMAGLPGLDEARAEVFETALVALSSLVIADAAIAKRDSAA